MATTVTRQVAIGSVRFADLSAAVGVALDGLALDLVHGGVIQGRSARLRDLTEQLLLHSIAVDLCDAVKISWPSSMVRSS